MRDSTVMNVNQNRRIIGIVGWISSGKDTVADYLVNCHNYRKDSFANTLKDAVAAVFGWDRELLEGRTEQAREWREQVDTWWAERLNMPKLSPRWILQHWGTEVCRQAFHDDIWIASIENKLRNSQDNIVISDCRFPNEIQAIKRVGGKVVWVKRGPLPDWYDDAVNFNAGQQRIGWSIGKYSLGQLGIHASEYSWIGTDFDLVIENNGTVDDLCDQIRNLVVEDWSATAALA